MNQRVRASLWIAASLCCGGCATIETASEVRPHSPRWYAGTRLDLAAIERDRETLDHFSSYNMLPPAHPRVDLPFSALLDTALLPFIAIYTISEPAVGVH